MILVAFDADVERHFILGNRFLSQNGYHLEEGCRNMAIVHRKI